MRERSLWQRALDTWRRHERTLIAIWLAVWTLALGGLALGGIALQGAERWVDRAQDRWATRLAEAEALADAGRWQDAAAALERLNREHPARSVLHARDRERERILERLGTAYLELGRRRRARETFDTLVEFDPLNWANHYARARASERLGDTQAALKGYREVLTLHPTHLPSVSAIVAIHSEAGDFAPVLETWENYLDAWRLAPFELTFQRPGQARPDARARIEVLADARPHGALAAIVLPPGWSGELEIASGGYSFELVGWNLLAPLEAGLASKPRGRSRHDHPSPVRLENATREADGVLIASAAGSRAVFRLAVPRGGADRIGLTLRVFKAASAETWSAVERAYENEIAYDALERARARTRVGGCLEGGSVFEP